MEAIVRHSKMACSTSALGQKRTFRSDAPCPLYPRKQTCAVHSLMSGLGQKRTFAVQKAKSALLPKADILRARAMSDKGQEENIRPAVTNLPRPNRFSFFKKCLDAFPAFS